MIPTITADGRVADLVQLPLTDEQATDVEAAIALNLGVMVRPVIDFHGTVHLHPDTALSTADEVAVLRAFKDVTDSPLAWHPHAATGAVS